MQEYISYHGDGKVTVRSKNGVHEFANEDEFNAWQDKRDAEYNRWAYYNQGGIGFDTWFLGLWLIICGMYIVVIAPIHSLWFTIGRLFCKKPQD